MLYLYYLVTQELLCKIKLLLYMCPNVITNFRVYFILSGSLLFCYTVSITKVMVLFISIMDHNYLHIKRIGDFRKHDRTQSHRMNLISASMDTLRAL